MFSLFWLQWQIVLVKLFQINFRTFITIYLGLKLLLVVSKDLSRPRGKCLVILRLIKLIKDSWSNMLIEGCYNLIEKCLYNTYKCVPVGEGLWFWSKKNYRKLLKSFHKQIFLSFLRMHSIYTFSVSRCYISRFKGQWSC